MAGATSTHSESAAPSTAVHGHSQPAVESSHTEEDTAATDTIDPVALINEKYQDATHFELNDALNVLARSVAELAQQRKTLLVEHFSCFVQCRAVMEEIRKDIDSAGAAPALRATSALTGRLEQHHAALAAQHQRIASTLKEHPDLSVEMRRQRLRAKYAPLFSLCYDLRRAQTFEAFVMTYQAATAAAAPVRDSQFVQRCFAEAQPIVLEFLESLYKAIVDETTSFEDAMYYFELYFAIQGDKTEEKVANTLLVNFKEKVFAAAEGADDFIGRDGRNLQYVLGALDRLVLHVPAAVVCEGVRVFYARLGEVLARRAEAEGALGFATRILQRVHDYTQCSAARQGSAEARTAIVHEMHRGLEQLKSTLAQGVVRRAALGALPGVFREARALLSDDALDGLRERVVARVVECVAGRYHVQTQPRDGGHGEEGGDGPGAGRADELCAAYEFLERDAGEVAAVRQVLGPPSSKWNKRLSQALAERRAVAVALLAEDLGAGIARLPVGEVLSRVVRLAVRLPTHYRRILFEAREAVMGHRLVFYFLAREIRMERPALSEEEKRSAARLQRQFGFLLGSG